MSEEEKVRLDKWLWAARFFKTRALATDAINGGHVKVNGARPKPSRPLHLGEEITIRKGPCEFVVTVRELSTRRGPATEAARLYEESEASRAARERLAEEQRLRVASGPSPERRPDKRQRRHIIRFSEKNS